MGRIDACRQEVEGGERVLDKVGFEFQFGFEILSSSICYVVLYLLVLSEFKIVILEVWCLLSLKPAVTVLILHLKIRT